MGSAQPTDENVNLGKVIADAIAHILKRCEEAGIRLAYPGEGGERAFRGWLVSDFLATVLGWPTEKIVVGERFDLLLQDSDGFPIATIETKTPYHRASKKERQDFEDRLSGFGTLRHAYFTNGNQWDRLDIFSPTGVLEVQSRFSLDLKQSAPEEVEAFFAPLAGYRYFRAAPRSARHGVSKDNPHILQALAADLDEAIADFAFLLSTMFAGFRDSKAGLQAGQIALNLFDLWCDKSLIVSPRQASEVLSQDLAAGGVGPLDIARALRDLGLGESAAADAVAALSEVERLDPLAVTRAVWPAYAETVRKLSAQSAHVILARALLYRIGEDQGVFPRLLSGERMEKELSASPSSVLESAGPATDLLLRVQDSMRGFLPAVYELGEFDWWQVRSDKRAALTRAERAWLRQNDVEFERIAKRLLRVLDGYFFGQVDVDVWRNVYQHYLPEEERQKIGGFYTPDELIDLVLDLAEYEAASDGLCRLSFIDPACGSGAFVANALARLLRHLALDLPCHAHLRKRGMSEWKRAEATLDLVSRNLHGVDLHPFAAFLTTVNVLFLLMPIYARAREKNPDYTLDLQVFSSDSLEKHDRDLLAPDLFTKLNARVQLTEESFRRYQEMLKKRFDRVFGNPPWGGVLKGPLAPVYDGIKKKRFAEEYPAAAQGKYDVYGLFFERALQILNPGGRIGMVTQNTFFDKSWAAGLRRLLATRSEVRFLVDLNPFGQLFFHAMNSPCITVADVVEKPDLTRDCITVLSGPPADFAGLNEDDRRRAVVATVRQAIERGAAGRGAAAVGFARSRGVRLQTLAETAKDRWNLATPPVRTASDGEMLTAADILDIRQGVTPGGCLDVFLMSEERATELQLETELVHKAIKSRELGRWSISWAGRVLLYPYRVSGRDATPAFTLRAEQIDDAGLREAIRRLGVLHSLDFDKALDAQEEEIVRRKGVNQATVGQLLKHRIALGLVEYPAAAAYLVQHYEQLEGRVFEKRRFTKAGKQWYEYHRPRDARWMFSKTRILSPTLVREVRFSLDTHGYLSDHACLYLQPAARTNLGYTALRNRLGKAIGKQASLQSVLKYCLAFLNGNEANERLRTRRPTPKGSYPVAEDYLREIWIPMPKKRSASAILELTTRLVAAKSQAAREPLERELGKWLTS
jgi:hypothetical protein